MPNSFEIVSVKPCVGLSDFRKYIYVSQPISMHPKPYMESYPHNVSHPDSHLRTPMDMFDRITTVFEPFLQQFRIPDGTLNQLPHINGHVPATFP